MFGRQQKPQGCRIQAYPRTALVGAGMALVGAGMALFGACAALFGACTALVGACIALLGACMVLVGSVPEGRWYVAHGVSRGIMGFSRAGKPRRGDGHLP